MIWPMSIITRAMNADDDATILQCLRWLKTTHGGTGFMHEAFDKDDPLHTARAAEITSLYRLQRAGA